MRKTNKLLTIITISLLFFLAFCNINLFKNQTQICNSNNRFSINADPPIHIIGNSQLNSTSSAGNGTLNNPYILENYVKDLGGANQHGIWIEDTDAYFIIQNCTVSQVGGGYTGIQLTNVSNSVIRNNTVNNAYYGIKLTSDSDLNTIRNNTIFNCGSDGIQVDTNSDHNTLINNTAYGNHYHGIEVSSSDYCIVNNNTLYDNNYGVYFAQIINASARNNALEANSRTGILISQSINVTVQGNLFTRCGIAVTGNSLTEYLLHEITPDNRIENRSIYYYKNENGSIIPRDAGQILLVNCTQMEISDYNLSYGSWGISLYSSNNNIISNNTFQNSFAGIFLKSSSYNLLTNNTANYNIAAGISVERNSIGNNLTDNIADGNQYCGIALLSGSHKNRVINNTVNDSNWGGGGIGLHIDGSHNNTLVNNTVTNNYRGLIQSGSDFNTLTNNLFKDNLQSGIVMDGSSWNTITKNTIVDNGYAGIYFSFFCLNNNLTENTILNNSFAGIYLQDGCDANLIASNTVSNNSNYGIFIDSLMFSSVHNEFNYNVVTFNGVTGFLVNSLDTNNTFYRNSIWFNAISQIEDNGAWNNWSENLFNPGGDNDSDGLTNQEEAFWMTNAFNSDTDFDSIPDRWEIINALDPRNGADALMDFDLDNLSNLNEFLSNTKVWDPDTDDDGLSDGAEVQIHGTNPVNPDTDDDGMFDGFESTNNLNPNWMGDQLLDLDFDGLSNLEEYYLNTDPWDADSDDDGYSDSTEVAAGTDPLDENSYPSPVGTGTESILLEVSIIVAGISLAVAIVVSRLLIRSPIKKLPQEAQKQSKKKLA